MIVFGLLDPVSEVRGILAAAFGPSADPTLYDHLSGLRSRFDRGWGDASDPPTEGMTAGLPQVSTCTTDRHRTTFAASDRRSCSTVGAASELE